MVSLTFLLCTYCAIIGTVLWLALYFTLWNIVHGWKNRYNLSIPMVVIDKVTEPHSSEDTKSLILDDRMRSTIFEKTKVAPIEGVVV